MESEGSCKQTLGVVPVIICEVGNPEDIGEIYPKYVLRTDEFAGERLKKNIRDY